jgi:hypothetical protein
MRRLVRLPGIVDDVVLEPDAALFEPVGELEVVKGGDRFDALQLSVPEPVHPARVLQIRRNGLDDRFGGRRLRDGRHTCEAATQQKRRRKTCEEQRRDLACVWQIEPPDWTSSPPCSFHL